MAVGKWVLRPGGSPPAGPARIGLLLRDGAMTTTSFQVPEVARPGPETVFAEVLADVLRVDACQSIATSLMNWALTRCDGQVLRASAEAREPAVGIYAGHLPTSDDPKPGGGARRSWRPGLLSHGLGSDRGDPDSTREYILCGALQALCLLAYSYAAVVGITEGYNWVSAGSSAVGIFLRLIVAAAWLSSSSVPFQSRRSGCSSAVGKPSRSACGASRTSASGL